MQLYNAVVVITGAGRGLGKVLAEQCAHEGAHVVVSGRTKKDVQEVAQSAGAFAIAADVTKEKAVQVLAQKTIKKFGRIDVWINNAGIWFSHTPIENLDMKEVRVMFEVNVFGVMYGSRAALAQMRKQQGGVIMNIISVSALAGRIHSAGYCASKFAEDGFTKTLRLETAQDNIRVVAVYPGGMKTNLFDEKKPADYHEYMDPEVVAQQIISNIKQETPNEELIIRRV